MSRDALVWLAEHLPDLDAWLIPDGDRNPRPLGKDGQKLLIHLCNRASEKQGGLLWCTRDDIRENTNLSFRSIDRWLAGFEQIGVLTRVGEIPNKRGRPTPAYRLTWVEKYAQDERKLSDYLPINRPGGQVKIVANTDTASETTKTENRQPKPEPKPQPEPEPVRTVQDSGQQDGAGKEKETAQIDDERLQRLTGQAVDLDTAEHGALNIPAAQAKRERDLRATLADFLRDYPDVSDSFLVAQAVDLVYATNRGEQPERARHNAEYALSEAQRRERQRAVERERNADYAAMTPEEREHDRAEKIASKEFVRATLAKMGNQIGRRMPDDDNDPF